MSTAARERALMGSPHPMSGEVHGRSVRLVESSRLASELPEPAWEVSRRHNLPAVASSLVGRSADIAGIDRLLMQHRLVTIAGTGGIGKTRLAIELGATAVDGYADGVWLAELADVCGADGVEDAVVAMMTDVVPGARVEVTRRLAQRHLLLILDNCEHLLESCATLAERLLHCCPKLSILTTSREPLGVQGEQVWWLGPLGLPKGDVDDDLDRLADSVRLLVERGRNARFDLTPDVYPAVAEICRRLDGVPLAIELAAARLLVLSPSEIALQLEDGLQFLANRRRATPPRHRSIRAALEWSHDLLSPEEARLFARLSVFAGGGTLSAIEQVCTDDGIADTCVLDLMEALVTKSLAVVDRTGRNTRYRMLETVRAFAASKLAACGESAQLEERHARWCLAKTEAAELERQAQMDQWLCTLDEDVENLQSALRWARRSGRADVVMALSVALTWFWDARGLYREGLDCFRWALAAGSMMDDELRAKAMRSAAILAWLAGDVEGGRPLTLQIIMLFRRVGNAEEEAGCVCSDAPHPCANPAHSLPCLDATVTRIRGEGDVTRLAHALLNCGIACFFLGDAAAASRHFDECLSSPLDREREVVMEALIGRGRVELLLGNLDDAQTAFEEALARYGVGDEDGRCEALSWLGEVSRVRGDLGSARSLLLDAIAQVGPTGPCIARARCTQLVGRLELTEGNTASARRRFIESLALPGAADVPYHRLRSLLGIAEVALAEGSIDEARALTDDAFATAETNGDAQAQGAALLLLAELALLGGDVDGAARLARQSLNVRERIGERPAVLASLETVAELAGRAGRTVLGARVLGSATAARARLGYAHAPAQLARHARRVQAIRVELGDSVAMAALEQGSSVSIDEAVWLVNRGWGSHTRPAVGWSSLTRAERDVTALVTQGMTNREIGDRLVISSRTVASHLTHIYGKLGIDNRRELAGAARERVRRTDVADADEGAHRRIATSI